MKNFEIPEKYRSPIISEIKLKRKSQDKMKRDFSPTVLDFGPVEFVIARHFGFCYGVENAIETIYKIIAENKERNIYLLSEMIHNPKVNQDLEDLGVRFLMDTKGTELISRDLLTTDDIVVIPAFGTTVEIEQELLSRGIQVEQYDTTCPFVEKVWKRSKKLGKDDFTILIHGKPSHEETRATFSHSKENGAAIVVKDINETKLLAEYILGHKSLDTFFTDFNDRTSKGFDPSKDLKKIGVVNQTTMLATDTQEIADYIKETLEKKEAEEFKFADTRDTLCYATSDNQNSVYGMLEKEADLAIVVGGYNSSNTSHLVELCNEKLTTFHIDSAERIINESEVSHLDFDSQKEKVSAFLPQKDKVTILVTSGASCPDSVVDQILTKTVGFFTNPKRVTEVLTSI